VVLALVLSEAELELKLEVATKLLTALFMKPCVPAIIAKLTAWQDSVARLLIKRPINVDIAPVKLPDLMCFEEDSSVQYGKTF